MRFQRNAHRGSRPEGLGHPKATKHTAESYRVRYVRPGPTANFNRFLRWARMERNELRDKSS